MSNIDLKIAPIIDGHQLSDHQGETKPIHNPATGQVIGQQQVCDARLIDQMVRSAAAAQKSGAWQSLAPSDRGLLLLKLADRIEQDAARLCEWEMLDTGKPLAQIQGGELPLTAAIIRFYAGAADKIQGAVKQFSNGTLSFTLYQPYGVVAGILPWNYPLVNVALKLAPALAAGNAIVLKPSASTSLTAVAVAELCTEVGIPPGIVSVALGAGSAVGNALVNHPAVSKISFTGSTAVGQAIQRQATDQLKAVNLELGGKNAIVVFDDADLERAAQAVLFSGYVNAGQLCVSCSRLLVHEPIAEKFLKLLADRMAQVKAGDPRNPATLVGPMITQDQYDTALKYIDIAKQQGATIRCGGGRPRLTGEFAQGWFIQPTLVTGVNADMRVAQEEIFGPCLSAITFTDDDHAVAIANGVPYGLSGSVWTNHQSRAMNMIQRIDTGLIWVNTMFTGYPQIPLSPHKMSGTGVELGMEGLMAYCKRKSAVIGYDDTAPVGWNLP